MTTNNYTDEDGRLAVGKNPDVQECWDNAHHSYRRGPMWPWMETNGRKIDVCAGPQTDPASRIAFPSTMDLSATDLSTTNLSTTDLSTTDLSTIDSFAMDSSTTGPSTTSPFTTDRCVCCAAAGKAVTTRRLDDADSSFGFGADRPPAGPPVVDRECGVCGYRWQKLRYPGPRGTVALHDFPSSIPGQFPHLDGPRSMLARREPAGGDEAGASSSNYFRVRLETDGCTREKITPEQFTRQLRRRQRARKGAVCN